MPALAVADRLTAAGAEVVFVGGQRAEAELVPAAGYELRGIRVEGLSRTNPLRAARALLRAGLRDRRRASACCASCGRARCSAAAATSPGPVGLAALARRIPLVLTEADSHLGITNRLLAGARAPGLPGVPDRGPQRPALSRDRPAGSAAGDGRRRRARPLRARARRAVRARLRRFARRADDQRGRGGGVQRGARFASCTPPARATTRRSCRASTARATTCARTSTTSPKRSPRATSASRAPAARSSRSRRRASRRSSCPIRMPAPTTRRRTHAGWRRPAPRSSCPTTS